MPYQTILVTGANGLLGSNICQLAAEEGRRVKGLVRRADDAAVLKDLGVEPVLGDITQPETLTPAAKGVDGIIHAAAVIGGTWSKATPAEFEAVNYQGVLNVIDAAERAGAQRTILVSTLAIFDPAVTITERSPILPIEPNASPYTAAKRASYYYGMHAAARGQNIGFIVPAAMYGPSPFVERAVHPTLFTGSLLMALRGELPRYAAFPMTWPFIEDAARIALAALDKGGVGARYLAAGRPEDTYSLAQFCNMGCEMAGSPHRVKDVPLAEMAAEIGTIAKLAALKFASPLIDPTETNRALGLTLTPLRTGLARTLDWLRANNKLP